MIITLLIVLLIIVVFTAADGTFIKKQYDSVWSDDFISRLEKPVDKILALGIRAQSSHNSQPWLIKVTSESSFELYADTEKTLAVVDRDNIQMALSQGTFIEAMVKGAKGIGYDVKVHIHSADMSSNNPLIASFEFNDADKIPDAVSGSSIKAESAGPSSDITSEVEKIYGNYENLSYRIIEKGEELEDLKNRLMAGTVAESEDEGAIKELLSFFRWTEKDKEAERFGLSLNSMPWVIKPFIQPVMKITSGNWESFGKSSIAMFEKRLENEEMYILVSCKEPETIDYINAGRAYQDLVFHAGGHVIKPAMQVLEDFKAMEDAAALFDEVFDPDNKVIMIIGISGTNGASVPNPRHIPKDIRLN